MYCNSSIGIKYEHVSTYSKPKINIISLKKLIATRCKLLTGLQVKTKTKINKNRKIKSNKNGTINGVVLRLF